MQFFLSGALPLQHILSIRRLGYFQTILKRDEKEVTKRIYRAQKKNPIPGDWVLLIEQDMIKYEIQLDEDQITSMDAKSFKDMVKYKVRKRAFSELSTIQMEHTKVQNIEYFGLHGPQKYLTSKLFNNKKRRLLYNLRCRSVNGIKDNFHRLYGDAIACPFLCLNQDDNQEHLLSCTTLTSKLSDNNLQLLLRVNYSHLFGTVIQQLDVTNMFLVLLGIRKRLLQTDQEPSCEGNNT